MTYEVGDLIIAKDDLGIINDCIGEIRSIDKAKNGNEVYSVEFDNPQGNFLLQKEQMSIWLTWGDKHGR
tara:strand:+ start:61 stop:267 length:207 start_codon:yes stop_codon:yes gene_type:complete